MYINDQNNVGTLSYLFTDHASAMLSSSFGSINLITDASGNTVQELSFDARGKRREPATWQAYAANASIPAAFIDRGFTFHEHLYPFTLINMNGRAGVYHERCSRFGNPLVGRFLSADPYIQAPDNPQNLNRYIYCLNNPLRYSDPTGDKWWNPVTWFPALMDWINDNTEGIRKEMVKAGIPDCGVGVTINGSGNIDLNASYSGQEVFNTQNIDKSNAEQKENEAFIRARQTSAYDYNQSKVFEQLKRMGFDISGITYMPKISEKVGVELTIGASGAENWLQTIRTNKPMGTKETEYIEQKEHSGQKTPWFYYDVNYMYYSRAQYTTGFRDTPHRPKSYGNQYWIGQLSYVSLYKNGGYQLDFTLKYGWVYYNGKYQRIPLQIIRPTKFHKEAMLWRGK